MAPRTGIFLCTELAFSLEKTEGDGYLPGTGHKRNGSNSVLPAEMLLQKRPALPPGGEPGTNVSLGGGSSSGRGGGRSRSGQSTQRWTEVRRVQEAQTRCPAEATPRLQVPALNPALKGEKCTSIFP